MIIRRRHTANFTTIGNVLFDDERLAADELGVLAFLRSKPHDWEVRRPYLMKRFRLGRDGLKRIVDNWLRYGWASALKVRQPNGTFDIVYEIRDEPGPSLSEEQVKNALLLVSSDGEPVNAPVNRSQPCSDATLKPEPCGQPPTSQPPLAEPPPARAYVVDSNILNTELPRTDSNQIEREGRGREHERKAKGLVAFEARWPTAAVDDRTRTANAWNALTADDEKAALAGIAPFLEAQKHAGRKHSPAGWKYLTEKRWALLEAEKSVPTAFQTLAAGSDAAKAVAVAYAIAGKASVLTSNFMRASDGGLYYRREVTPRLMALASAPHSDHWVTLEHQQAGAWNALLTDVVMLDVWTRLSVGSKAPWPWPPRKDGTITTESSDTLMNDKDLNDLDQLGKMTG